MARFDACTDNAWSWVYWARARSCSANSHPVWCRARTRYNDHKHHSTGNRHDFSPICWHNARAPARRSRTAAALPCRRERVVVADEEEAFGGDPAQCEAQALQPLGQDGPHAVHVQHVVGAAVLVHQARQHRDLRVAPAVEAVQEISHGRYGNVDFTATECRVSRAPQYARAESYRGASCAEAGRPIHAAGRWIPRARRRLSASP